MNGKGFASDNNSGVSPEVFRKMEEVNKDHAIGYGDDVYTEKAISLLREQFGSNCSPYLLFTGTGANVLSIAAVACGGTSVICAETAHIQEDECGAPERFTGCKLIPVRTPDGKLTPSLIKPHLRGFGFEHHSQPRLISISQATEMGTLYSIEEINAIADLAHENNMLLHIDGARLANAAASLNVSLKEMTAGQGADIVSFGGTKNGLMAAESVIFLNNTPDDQFKYIRKQGMQLASKMRFIAAQFIAYLENDLWKKNAVHANKMASLLYSALKELPAVRITQKVQANGIFAVIPSKVIPLLQKEYFFYVWNEEINEVRWMTSFDTTEKDIHGFVSKLKDLLDQA